MISLFPLTKVITVLCAIYGALLAILFAASGPNDLSENLISSLRYAALYEILILGALLFGWRYLWKWFPALNEFIFPDIHGIWDVEIHWTWGDKTGVKKGKAYIKQSFIGLSMELITDESESETLVVQPRRNSESGRLQLFYIYRNIPKNIGKQSPQPHIGTAILKFDPIKISALEGNYFTDRDTKGIFKLINHESHA